MRRLVGLLLITLAACGDARVTAPSGTADFARVAVLGTGLSMGEQSAGVVYETQVTSWGAQLAARMGTPFRVPALRQPGCTPLLVAPLSAYRFVSGAITPLGAVSCAGRLGSDSLPANIVAMVGATAWDALHTTPRSFLANSSGLDATRYGAVLPSLQTQVLAMQSLKPTLVAVELGASEVWRTLTGVVTAGASYTQKTAWTLIPASVFSPVLDSIADSVATTKAKAVFLGVPSITALPALRAGDALWQDRAALATYRIAVAADCQGSANLLNTAALLPSLAAAARDSSKTLTLSCADRPGVADYVLTPSDVATITQTITAINTAIKAAAEKRGFAYAETTGYYTGFRTAPPAFSAATFLSSDLPYGLAVSLDGVQPSATGQAYLADDVATALNAKYGWSIPIPPRLR